jgi:hypothetical protein
MYKEGDRHANLRRSRSDSSSTRTWIFWRQCTDEQCEGLVLERLPYSSRECDYRDRV